MPSSAFTPLKIFDTAENPSIVPPIGRMDRLGRLEMKAVHTASGEAGDEIYAVTLDDGRATEAQIIKTVCAQY